ncbi:MAG: DUF4292 domain-containing protein [Prevotella sp.]|jgi:hypothetical protein
MKHSFQLLMLGAVLFLASCGAKKNLVNDGSNKTAPVTQTTNKAQEQLAFVQKVSDNRVYAENIVASLSFNAQAEGKDITVPGQLRMRRNEVIRLQLFVPLLGSEVGRLEFTPDYVLVVDRIHKEYIKGDYNQLDFLRDNGLNFYSLQSLFWNQLLLPGTTRVGEGDLIKFSPDLDETGQNVPITLKNGNLTFVWTANRQDGKISQADITYIGGKSGKSNLKWNYSDFKPLGSKQFPATQEFSFTTNATGKQKSASVRLEMNSLKTNSDWDAQTTVSDRYKKVEAQDVLGKLLKM